MKYLLSILLLIPLTASHGQSTSLSQAGGLDNFKIGTSINEFEGMLKMDVSISYGQDYYIFTGEEPAVYFGLRIRQIHLGFFKEKLNYIDFYFRKPDDASFDALKESLTRQFGIPLAADDADENGLWEAYRWTDETMILHLKRYGPNARDWDDQDMTVLVFRLKDLTGGEDR